MIPTTVVPRQPIRWRPGTNQPAMAPAIRPIRIQANGLSPSGMARESYDATGSKGAVKSAITAPLRTATGKATSDGSFTSKGTPSKVQVASSQSRRRSPLIASGQSPVGLHAPTTE